MDFVWGNSEQFSEPPLRPSEPLARRIDDEIVAVPCGDDRMRLHRIVVLRRRLVGGRNLLRRRSETSLDVATTGFRRMSGTDHRRHEALGRIKSDPGRLDLIARRQQYCALGRGLERLRNHDCDRLVGITHAIALQQIEPEGERIGLRVRGGDERRPICRCHHLDSAGMRLGGRNIEKADASAGDAAHRHDSVKHSRGMIVCGVACGAGDFENALATHEGLADVRAVADVRRRLREGDVCGAIRHERPLPVRRQRVKPAAPAIARVCRRRRVSARARRCAAPARS